jgi:hypothetical protein
VKGLARLAIALAGVVACDAGVGHVFGGYPYDEKHDCLGATEAVDVIEGPEPASCSAVRCWRAPSGVTYVTDRACDAPPDYIDGTHDTTGPCVKALEAYGRTNPKHGRCPGTGSGGADGGGVDGGS